ncbi:MAG: metallophosphoesterase [Candidatus Heimdallarchaeota archaeon]|nr:MAG: metallophosphoesterase [Candidatus Heimdallarchaeota archaeon]
MSEEYIRFLHISDSHFGVHYALNPKNLYRRAYGDLFFQKIAGVIQKAVSDHKVDFIIHSGDFFNRSKPPPDVVDRAVKAFQPAIHKEIPLYILPGNHERSKLPLGLLPFSNENINLFTKPTSFIFKRNGVTIKLTGFPYIREYVKKKFSSLVKRGWNRSNGKLTSKVDYSILVIHQLIEGSCIENYTFRRGHNVISFREIPQKFNYIACGHVHRFQFLQNVRMNSFQSTNEYCSVKQNYPNNSWHFNNGKNPNSHTIRGPVISYAGTLERVSIAERNEPKGYIIGQIDASRDGIQSIEYKFHKVPAIRMIFIDWDLNKHSMTDYTEQTLDILYRIHKDIYSSQSQKLNGLIAIMKVRIRGKGSYSNKDIQYLKQEAIRYNFYLTISYRS